MLVFVINKNNEPLMPCKPSVARKLIKQGKAKIFKHTPFTIQLLYGSSGYKQEITLGIDAGSKNVGLSATTAKDELFVAEARLRTDIPKLLSERSGLRHLRRSRTTRYRQHRTNNNYGKGWLPPTPRQKIASHLKLVNEVKKILPVTKCIIEGAQFDIQKLEDPMISGDQYQYGELYGYKNRIAYLLAREDYTCQYCGKKDSGINNGWRLHHIWGKEHDRPKDWALLHESCHKGPEGIHKKHDEAKLQEKEPKSYKDAAFMNIMRMFVFKELKKLHPNTKMTYGYITKIDRNKAGLKKSHINDAYTIAGNMTAKQNDTAYIMQFVRKNNRSLHKLTVHKGGCRELSKQERVLRGFRLYDKVLYDNEEYFIFGRREKGAFVIENLSGTRKTERAPSKLKLLEMQKTLLVEKVDRAFLTA